MNSQEIEQKISETEELLQQVQIEKKQIGDRIAWLKDELIGLEWPKSTGQGQAARRYDQAIAETRALEKAQAEREGKIEVIQAELAQLHKNLAGAQIDEAKSEARRVELAWYEAWAKVLDLRLALKEAEHQRIQKRQELDLLIQQIQDLGGHHSYMPPPDIGDDAARPELQRRIERLKKVEAQTARLAV